MLQGYDKTTFEASIGAGAPVRHDVYARGDGPVVVIVQELPGIGRAALHLADRFVERGFRVVMPHLFGPLGRVSMVGNLVRVFCLRREFTVFRAGGTSPVVTWLRALCRAVRDERGVPGVGVIGMCLTGNFAMSLMADDSVLGGVASQPSVPLVRPGALHMSAQDVVDIRARLDEVGPMMALRFDGDRLCGPARFAAIDAAFNDDAERVRLRTLRGRGHSVLTLDLVDEEGHPTHEALQEVLAYFEERLGG
jgi:dienelactone hydrolase